MGAYLDSALRAEALHELTLPSECSFHLLTQPSRACIVSVCRGRSLPDTPIPYPHPAASAAGIHHNTTGCLLGSRCSILPLPAEM